MAVSQIMNRNIVRVTPDAALEKLLLLQAKPTTRQLYVTDPDGRLLGIITGFDLLQRLIPGYMDANLVKLIVNDDEFLADTYKTNKTITAQEFMTEEFTSLRPDASALDADVLVVQCRFNAIPVLDESGRLQGEVSRKDILAYICRLAKIGF